MKDVKLYLNVATIASDGSLVVKRNEPLVPTRECIIVPRQVLDGLLSALHVHLSHPSSHQLKLVTQRYLFALDKDIAVDRVILAAIIALHSARSPPPWCSSLPIPHLKLRVSPLLPTSLNEPNSLYLSCVNASLPTRHQPSFLTNATTRSVLTCDHWTVLTVN